LTKEYPTFPPVNLRIKVQKLKRADITVRKGTNKRRSRLCGSVQAEKEFYDRILFFNKIEHNPWKKQAFILLKIT